MVKSDFKDLVTKKDFTENIEGLRTDMKADIESLRIATKADIENLRVSTKKDMVDLRKDMGKMENRIVNKIINKLNIVINYFDRSHLSLDKRVTRIEGHLGFTSTG